MSAPETRNPKPEDQPGETISLDPLLDSGSFIDPGQPEPESESEQEQEHTENVSFAPGTVIDAEPISMVSPDDVSAASPKPAATPSRRNPEEMAKRPDWLPEGWKIDLKVRTSGATAGLIDRYYVEPMGKRKFRSKNEVLNFLETGSKLKRKINSEEDAASSGASTRQKVKKFSVKSPTSQKQKKSSVKSKKADTLASDNSAPTTCS